MAYQIDNAIVKKDRTGKLTLIDPEGQLLINSILNNDFKSWRELGTIPDSEPVKSLLPRLGYSRDDIAKLLKEF